MSLFICIYLSYKNKYEKTLNLKYFSKNSTQTITICHIINIFKLNLLNYYKFKFHKVKVSKPLYRIGRKEAIFDCAIIMIKDFQLVIDDVVIKLNIKKEELLNYINKKNAQK